MTIDPSEYIIYHEIPEFTEGHILEIRFPKDSTKDQVKTILDEAGKDGRHPHFFNRSGAYVYFLEHKDKAKVYVGQATQLESRALNKGRLLGQKVSKVLLFSNIAKHQFDESQIQHLEYYILKTLNNSSWPVKNVQSVAPSITTASRTRAVEGWFDSVKEYLFGKFDGVFDASDPVGYDLEIELTCRNNKSHYCVGKARYNPNTERVLILKEGTVASHARWQVPLTYQKVKTALISTGQLSLQQIEGSKYSHAGYVFKEDTVVMNISEATTIILNAPQAANAWFLVGSEPRLTLQEYRDRVKK